MMDARLKRVINVMHHEAFQLMNYACDANPSVIHAIWNSRDGVTPFCAMINDQEFTHAMNTYQPEYFGELPRMAEYVWIDTTKEKHDEFSRKSWAHYSTSDHAEDFLKRYPKVEDWVSGIEYKAGQPTMISKADYIEMTSSWIKDCPDGILAAA